MGNTMITVETRNGEGALEEVRRFKDEARAWNFAEERLFTGFDVIVLFGGMKDASAGDPAAPPS